MVQDIQTFVEKLQTEGVQAGRQEARKLLDEAGGQVQKIIEKAKADAEKLIADARAEADDVLARAKAEMQLAVRDDLLRLREALLRTVEAVLTYAVKEQFAQDDFLCTLLHDLVMQYAKADIEGRDTMTINVTPETRDRLCHWALQELSQKAGKAGLSIDLKGALTKAGFEYTLDGGKVDVTVESIVETLSDLVGPDLLEILKKAASQ